MFTMGGWESRGMGLGEDGGGGGGSGGLLWVDGLMGGLMQGLIR